YEAASGHAAIVITQAKATLSVDGYTGVYDGNSHGATGSAKGAKSLHVALPIYFGAKFTTVPGGTADWNFAGDTNYEAASGHAAIAINQADATISVDGYTGVYDGNPHGATGSAKGVKGEDLTSLLNFGAKFTTVPGGTADWNFAGDTNYEAASSHAAIVINQAKATISVDGYTGVYDGGPHGATGSAKGVKGEDLTSLLNFGAKFTTVPGGTADWNFAGDTNYEAASGHAAIVINQAKATLSVDGYTGVYDGNPHSATGSAKGVKGEDLTSLLNFGAKFTTVPGGTADWNFAGDANYEAASGHAAIVITQAKATISVDGYTGIYDGAPHSATGSAKGVNGEDLSSLLNLGATFTTVPGGTADWSFAGNTNYEAAGGHAAIVINQAKASISVDGYTGVYDGAAHGATGSAKGVKSEDLTSLLNFGVKFTAVPGGTADWNFAGDANYETTSGHAAIV